MIPKVIHRIWFGERPVPAEYEKFWSAWRRQLPAYEFKTWRNADIASLSLTAAKIDEAEGLSRKADVARYEILLREGGVYLDCDMMPYQFLDFSALRPPVIVCSESGDDRYCSVGFLAATPGASIFEWAVQALQRRPLNREPPHRETGPWFFRQAMAHGEFERLPSDAFYPYLYDETFSRVLLKDLAKTFGIHVWGGSWLGPDERQRHAVAQMRHGSLSVIADSESIASLAPYRNATRAARKAALTAAKHVRLGNGWRVAEPAVFEFLKVCFYLVQREPEALVWQIGAADGVLADPLRPLLVNYDLRAVLMEPSPYLFEALARNYRNNTRAQFLNCALADAPGSLTLNTINPTAVKERGLPEWVAGISSFYTDRNALGGHTIDADLTRQICDCVEKLSVPTVGLKSVLDINGGTHPDIVVVDTEGMDGAIVESILKAGVRPSILHYETQCMPAAERARLGESLATDYICLPYGNDTVAYRRDLFFGYCDHLYVEEGYPTIYADRLKFAMRI